MSLISGPNSEYGVLQSVGGLRQPPPMACLHSSSCQHAHLLGGQHPHLLAEGIPPTSPSWWSINGDFWQGASWRRGHVWKRKQHFSVSAECWVSVERVSESPMSEWTEWAVQLLSESLATAAGSLTNLQIARKLFAFLRWLKNFTYCLLNICVYMS